jgi:transposase
MGVSENNGDGKVRSTGTTQTLLETKLYSSKKKKSDVEGEGAVNERTAQRWFKRFASGNLSLEDEQRPGRPRIWDSEATKEAAEQQPSTSTR